MSEVDVSVLVVNYNTAHLLAPMFDALQAATGDLRIETILVDNASRDDSVELIKQHHSGVRLIENQVNVGFGRANNQCLPFARGKYVLLLNTDAFIEPDTLKTTVAHLEQNPGVGALGVRLLGEDGSLQPSCRFFPTPLNSFLLRTGLQGLMPWVPKIDDFSWDHLQTRTCDWVPGCYMLIRRDVVSDIGLFDPRYFMYCEEVDLCKRIKAKGLAIHYVGEVSAMHIGGESAKSDAKLTSGRQISALQTESELLYFRKHHGVAGLLCHLLLAPIGDLILAAKATLRGRTAILHAGTWLRSPTLWRAAVATQFGLKPTR